MVNNINKKVNKQSNPGKRIHKNWIYFRDLEKRIKKYPKIDKIELENEEQERQMFRLPKTIEKKEIEHMSIMLLKNSSKDKQTEAVKENIRETRSKKEQNDINNETNKSQSKLNKQAGKYGRTYQIYQKIQK